MVEGKHAAQAHRSGVGWLIEARGLSHEAGNQTLPDVKHLRSFASSLLHMYIANQTRGYPETLICVARACEKP